jgi:hypothetical protein
MQECRKFRNFASMSAIITALQSAPIARLTLTNNELLPPAKQLLDNLSHVLDPAHDHRAYKAALNETLDPEFKDSCIPWLGKYSCRSFFSVYLTKYTICSCAPPRITLAVAQVPIRR